MDRFDEIDAELEEIEPRRWWRDYPFIPDNLYKLFDLFGLYSIYYILEEDWLDHVAWRIAHHVQGQKCENCSNWDERKTISKDRWGWCNLLSPLATLEQCDGKLYVAPTIHEHSHGWCHAWGGPCQGTY